ncbi:MAG: DUF72 domain-containing protein [Gammaproteobacteria bacterium]|nr:DUF72 domain-containing protein [Gammaproteobacteria bacterium]
MKQRLTNLTRVKEMRSARLKDKTTYSLEEKDLKKVMIGCSGWFYWHWRNQFYPSTLSTNKWFGYYRKYFDTVELNAPFYNWPSVSIVKSWLRQVGKKRFCYTIKVSELITHLKRFKSTKRMITDFNYIGDLLGDYMGCFLYQLPPSYQYTKTRLNNIIAQLEPGRRNVVEFRHKSWWNKTVYNAFKKNNIIFCSVSSPNMPDELIQTTDEVYIRFHGTSKLYLHDYTKEEMNNWVERIKIAAPKRVWAYFNNDREANAIKNAKWFKKQINKLFKI